jgi:tripartite-type tricarboxylate transporter receptor subunit TctC
MKKLLLSVASALSLCVAVPAMAEYPDKPIKLIVPYPPGGAMDMIARIAAKKLSDEARQPVIVDNRAGASGNIGMDIVAKSPKDGYTLLLAPAGLAAHEHFFAKLPFNPEKDFIPVVRIANQQNVIVVSPILPVTSVKELIEYAKKNPGKLRLGTSGLGTSHDVSARVFMAATGTDMLLIPYKGGAPALVDLVGGHIDLMFDTPSTAVPYIHAGKIRALGVTGEKRLPGIPEVPTIAEAAVPGFNFFTWAGIATPSGVPEPVVKRLEAMMQKVVAAPETRQELIAIDLEPIGGTSKEFQDLVRRESAMYARIVKDNNITPQ